jgi:plasmid stabilization system protein ParE
MKIYWTPTSRLTYFKVLEYLSENWAVKEIETFIYKTEHTIAQIAENPYMYKASSRRNNVRKGFITEHNCLYYRVKPIKKEIDLLTFWDNRRDPMKIMY